MLGVSAESTIPIKRNMFTSIGNLFYFELVISYSIEIFTNLLILFFISRLATLFVVVDICILYDFNYCKRCTANGYLIVVMHKIVAKF